MGDKINRGRNAALALESATLNECFDAIEAEQYERFLASAHGDDALRRACQDRINAIREVRQQLRSWITTGRLEEQKGG